MATLMKTTPRGSKPRSGLEIADVCLQREGGSIERIDKINIYLYLRRILIEVSDFN